MPGLRRGGGIEGGRGGGEGSPKRRNCRKRGTNKELPRGAAQIYERFYPGGCKILVIITNYT